MKANIKQQLLVKLSDTEKLYEIEMAALHKIGA